MYKDKDRQREANRQASQRQRDKKGMTDDCAKAGIVIPDHPVPVIPKRGKDIKCFEDLPVDVQQMLSVAIRSESGDANYETQDAVCTGVVTGKPGDADYNGICTPEWRAERGR